MSTLGWIAGTGLLMSAIALVGSVTLAAKEATLTKAIPWLVALAAGSLLGGAWFHMMPAAVDAMGNGLAPWLWLAAGFLMFLALERVLRWHHCHDLDCEHDRTLGWLVLVADGLHNFIGGLAVAGAFLIDVRLGLTAWIAAAAHEIPQELGDFGVLVHKGWSPRSALLFNFASALTFPIGGGLAYYASFEWDVSFLLPFAAGNFIYIASADLIPELQREHEGRGIGGPWLGLLLGLLLLLVVRLVFSSHG